MISTIVEQVTSFFCLSAAQKANACFLLSAEFLAVFSIHALTVLYLLQFDFVFSCVHPPPATVMPYWHYGYEINKYHKKWNTPLSWWLEWTVPHCIADRLLPFKSVQWKLITKQIVSWQEDEALRKRGTEAKRFRYSINDFAFSVCGRSLLNISCSWQAKSSFKSLNVLRNEPELHTTNSNGPLCAYNTCTPKPPQQVAAALLSCGEVMHICFCRSQPHCNKVSFFCFLQPFCSATIQPSKHKYLNIPVAPHFE